MYQCVGVYRCIVLMDVCIKAKYGCIQVMFIDVFNRCMGAYIIGA